MGTVIKARRDGYRRAGLIHRVAGTFYAEGDLSEEQLEMLRDDPHLLVVEGVQEDALQAGVDSSELLHEMGVTIARLEHDLESERAGLNSALSTLTAIREHQVDVPRLVLDAIRLLEPAAPGEGVISIKEDALAEIIVRCMKEKSDASQSTPNSSGSPEAPPLPASDSAVPPATGDAGAVKAEKPASKRATTEKKGGGE